LILNFVLGFMRRRLIERSRGRDPLEGGHGGFMCDAELGRPWLYGDEEVVAMPMISSPLGTVSGNDRFGDSSVQVVAPGEDPRRPQGAQAKTCPNNPGWTCDCPPNECLW